MTTYIALAFALGIVLGRWSRKPRTGDWMRPRFDYDYSDRPEVRAARRVR
jgi:hypothetical protein